MKTVYGFAVIAAVMMISPAYAQLGSQSFGRIDFSDSIITDAEIYATETTFSNPGILPDSPLYFAKKIWEGVRLFFAFNPEDKAKLHMEFSKTRMAEAKKMIEEENIEKAKESIDSFVKELDSFDSAYKGIGSTSTLAKEGGDVLEKSAMVLSLAVDKVPEQAKPAVERALIHSIEKKVSVKANAKGDEAAIRKGIDAEIKKHIEISRHAEEKAKKAEERIKEAMEQIAVANAKIESGDDASTASALISQSEKKLEEANEAMNQSMFGEAFGHATAAKQLAENAGKSIERKEKSGERRKESRDDEKGAVCIQVITPAVNPKTGECREFPTPCDVPEVWEKTDECNDSIQK